MPDWLLYIMKLTKPLKFRRAIKELVLFLEEYNGIQNAEHLQLWTDLVYSFRSKVDEKDLYKYLKITDELEQLGIYLGAIYVKANASLLIYTDGLAKIHKKLSSK